MINIQIDDGGKLKLSGIIGNSNDRSPCYWVGCMGIECIDCPLLGRREELWSENETVLYLEKHIERSTT